jgi:hypothetical protein
MDLGSMKHSANCPCCKSPIEFTLAELAAEASVACGGCGGSVKLNDQGGGAKKLLGDVEDIVGQFPKEITIKL